MQNGLRRVCERGFSLIELIVALGILLIITSFIVSAFTNGLKTVRRERSFAERDADVKRAIELMTIELGQAGVTPEILPRGVTISGITGSNVDLTTSGNISEAIQGLYPQRPIVLGLPEGGTASEVLTIADVNSGCSAPCVVTTTPPALTHPVTDYISSPMLPNPFGILNPPPAVPIPGPPFKKPAVTRIGFVGDILSNGDLYYVEYKYDSSTKRLSRTMKLLKDGSGYSDVVLLENVETANFTIFYSAANIPIPISVHILIIARSSLQEPNGEFKSVTATTDVMPRGTAAAALIWASGGESQLRKMIPPCSSTKYPPCSLWNTVPWWSTAISAASGLL